MLRLPIVSALLILNVSFHAQKLFELLPATATGINFVNRSVESADRCIYQYDYFYNGGGVAILDFNRDGLPDIFFTGNDVPNKLYHNLGEMKFTEVPFPVNKQHKKWYTGVTVTDINSDGWPDLYLCCSGPDFLLSPTTNELYVNNGDGTFTEKAREYGIDDNGLSTQAYFFDIDYDGDRDLLVLNHAVRNLANRDREWLQKVKSLSSDQYLRFCSSLYINENNSFNIDRNLLPPVAGFGLGAAIADFDQTGGADIFISHDYFIDDQFLFYQSNGLKDKAQDCLRHTSFYSMGCDAADVNNDGLVDLVVLDMTPADHYRNKTNMNSMNVPEFRYITDELEQVPQYMFNTLQINRGIGIMSEIGQLAGIHQSDWSWAPLLADFDLDGKKDLFITNGYKRDIKNNDWRVELMELMQDPGFNAEMYFRHLQKAPITPIANQMYHNSNGYEFSNVGESWGITHASFSNGAAYADLDLDGDLDLVINNLEQEAFVYRNTAIEQSKGHFLRIALDDACAKSDLSVATIKVYSGGTMQFAENRFCRGYQSHMEEIIHFGLGENNVADSIIISWNRGLSWTMKNIKSDQVLRLSCSSPPAGTEVRDEFPLNFPWLASSQKHVFMSNNKVKFDVEHIENDFDDFEKEILLPHRQSQHGPGVAVADINSDAIEDIFIGGAMGYANYFMMGQSDGNFIKVSAPGSAAKECLGAAFTDVDNDADADLIIAYGGGGEIAMGDTLLSDELWINDGKGNFTQDPGFPAINISTQVIKPCDFDGDGDQDIFIGGRNEPGKYPFAPSSYIMINDKGKFKATRLGDETNSCGLVTDAVWHDWEGDGDLDLLVVGEWTTLQLWINDHGTLHPEKFDQQEELFGWWYSIATGDIDNDDDDDLVLGNLGWNNKFHPTKEKPLHVYAHDFDDNGTTDIVLSKHYRGKQVPVRGRECSSAQMPYLAKKFPTFNQFASSALDQIYDSRKLDEALHLHANNFSSVFMINEGAGKYRKAEMPVECQFSPITDIEIGDYNNDGNNDILMAGNNTLTEVETMPYDAGYGTLLLGKGTGEFDVQLNIFESGLLLTGNIRAILPIEWRGSEGKDFIVVRNNARMNMISSR